MGYSPWGRKVLDMAERLTYLLVNKQILQGAHLFHISCSIYCNKIITDIAHYPLKYI